MPDQYAYGMPARFTPSDSMRHTCAAALRLRDEHRRGGTAHSVGLAQHLADGGDMSASTIRRLQAFFDRHTMDQGWFPGEEGYPSKSRIQFELAGGTAGQAWVRDTVGSFGRRLAASTEIDLRDISKQLARVQKDTHAQLVALGEAAFEMQYARLTDMLPPNPANARLQAASITELLEASTGAYERLRKQVRARIQAARDQTAQIIAKITQEKVRDVKDRMTKRDVDAGFNPDPKHPESAVNVAADRYSRRIEDRTVTALLDPESVTGLADPDEVDETTAGSAATRAATEALAVASGEYPPDGLDPPTVESPTGWIQAITSGLVAAAFLNALISDADTELSLGPEVDDTQFEGIVARARDGFVWVWGPGPKGGTFEPHKDRDGTMYSSFDDPGLATDPTDQVAGWLAGISPYDYPGIFSACGCTKEPIL